MSIPELHIDRSLPALERWQPLHPFTAEAKELLTVYLADLGGLEQFGGMLTAYRDAFIEPEYAAELAAIATIAGVSEDEALIGNLYYDAIKLLVGCTAFAIDTDDGPLHARNLDWWTENGLLARDSIIVNFSHSAASQPFRAVSWPGYIGVLSGVAAGRFAITLNAVLSRDPPALAQPVTFLLRSVFETARTFDEAVDRLVSAEIASDCLLLVTGTRQGEMAVIERTPTRAAVRRPKNGYIVVANEYLSLDDTGAQAVEQPLQETSEDRYCRTAALLEQSVPRNVADCFAILSDPAVQMRITVQQMVMSASRNLLDVRVPA